VYVDYRPIQKLFWTTMWFIDLIEVFGYMSTWTIGLTEIFSGLQVHVD